MFDLLRESAILGVVGSTLFFKTSWQDLAIMVSGFIFSAALVPTIWHQLRTRKSTIPVTTSLSSSVALVILLPAYASLGLWIGATMITVNLLMWVVVMAQRMRYKGG